MNLHLLTIFTLLLSTHGHILLLGEFFCQTFLLQVRIELLEASHSAGYLSKNIYLYFQKKIINFHRPLNCTWFEANIPVFYYSICACRIATTDCTTTIYLSKPEGRAIMRLYNAHYTTKTKKGALIDESQDIIKLRCDISSIVPISMSVTKVFYGPIFF